MLQKPTTCLNCPLYSGPFGSQWGYVPQDGSGDNGVLIILEAAGEDEAACGRPVVGAAGQFLWRQLKPLGIEREGFRIHNVLSCRPPDNKLLKMAYTEGAIRSCSPNVDRTIDDHLNHCRVVGKTPVIVALGKFSFKRLMGIESDHHPLLLEDYFAYPQRLARYGCWLYAAPHPSHIMQGKNNLIPILQFVFERALEVASEGLILDEPTYLLDPDPHVFSRWAEGYFASLAVAPGTTYLSYDIETPYKSGKTEDEVAREDDDDYIILRTGYAYNTPDGQFSCCSVPWQPDYLATHEQLFSTNGALGINWNGSGYDDIRIRQQVPLNLVTLDAMLAWHVLNTSLPKGLGFVTPYYVKNTGMWKHLATPPRDMDPIDARLQEAFYNAKDAHMALLNWMGIQDDLKANGLWGVFDRHVVQLNKVLSYMSEQGVLLDKVARQSAEDRLQVLMAEIYGRMQEAVPIEARALKVYKKEPKDVTHLIKVGGSRGTKQCPMCHQFDVNAPHFKSVGVKRLKRGEPENPCCGQKPEKVDIQAELWAKPLPFKISKVSLTKYQAVKKHKGIFDRKTKRTSFDVKAMKTLMVKYPDDQLYPIILEFRKIQKLASTYVGITQWKEVEVDADYVLKPGEQWKEDCTPAVGEGWDNNEPGWACENDVQSHPLNAEAGE